MSALRTRSRPTSQTLPSRDERRQRKPDRTAQAWAIALTQQLKDPEEEQDVISEAERETAADIFTGVHEDMEESSGLWEAPDQTDESEAPGDPAADDGVPAELSESLRDEDDSTEESETNSFEGLLWPEAHYAWDPSGNPIGMPKAAIEIDEFGEVHVPREIDLNRSLTFGSVALFDPDGRWGRGMKRVEILRALGRAIVAANRDAMLGGPSDFTAVRFAPLTQSGAAQGITVPANVSVLVAHEFVKTPRWGIVPLAAFFAPEARRESWEETLERVRALLDEEDVRRPLRLTKRSRAWARLVGSCPHLQELQDNRMLRENMKARGLPLSTGRKAIYESLESWYASQDPKPGRVNRSEIPDLCRRLVAEHGLFGTKGTRIYQEERFRPFVEKRVVKILEGWNVTVA